MKNLIDALTQLVVNYTKNPYIRFIAKKNTEVQSIKAYKNLKIELFLHTPGKNIKCLECSNIVNTSNISEELLWTQAEPHFYNNILSWIFSGKLKEFIDGLQME